VGEIPTTQFMTGFNSPLGLNASDAGDTMTISSPTLSKNKRKQFELTDYHLDFLRAVRKTDQDRCRDALQVQRILCEMEPSPDWMLDVIKANIVACSLLKRGYLNGEQCSFYISEKGLGVI
jgi:hypothetical protein